jgi:seryl-tRNA synthetase
MLDIQYIRDHKEEVAKATKDKKVSVDIDRLLELDGKRTTFLREIEELKSIKNDINDLITKATPEERIDLITRGKEVKEKLDKKEPEYNEVLKEYEEILWTVPNVPSVDTPIGADEHENVVLREVGTIPTFSFQPKEHWDIGERLDIIDIARAGKVSGSRFAYLKGDAVMLEFALVQFVFSILQNEKILSEIIRKNNLKVTSKSFVPVVPPVFIKPEPFARMARINPKEERYHIPTDDLYLVGSAEHTLGSMHMDEVIPEKDMPIRYIGFSPAFRREAGSYGKDTKGILRVHQFDKLEIESFSVPENSLEEQNFFVSIQEHIVQDLGIPYRVMQICTGDMGGPDARQIDIECWLPGQGKYRETHTSDLMTDYQSRRLNTKVRRENGSLEYVHMNDATAVAIGRILIAILENFQRADGSVIVPEVLRPFVGKDVITPKK